MNIKLLKQNLFNQSEELQMKYTLWMNHLLVVYAFLLPISNHAKAQIQFVILGLFFIRSNFKKYLSESIQNPVVIAFILYFSMYILWLIGTENFNYASKLIDQNKYAVFFPILIFSFFDKRMTTKVISGFLIGVLFSEIFSYMISLNIIPWKYTFLEKELYQAFAINDPSPFLHHTKYGLVLAIGVTFLIHNLLTQSYTIIEKLIAIFFILSITINMSITGGRVGYLTYIILAFTLLILYFRKRILKPLLAMIIFFIIIASTAYNYSSLFKERINYTINTIEKLNNNHLDFSTSFGARLGMWYYSSDVIKNNFLFGVGTGDHIDAIKQNIKINNAHYEVIKHPHNQFISILLQFGIIGLIIFLNIFYQTFIYNYISNYNRNIAFLTTISIIISFLIEGDLVKFYLPFWILFISISITNKEYSSIPNINNFSILKYILITAVSMILAFFI